MSNVLFGEIIEPSSRALYESDEDSDDAPKLSLKWELKNSIEIFIIVEGKAMIDLFTNCVIKNALLVCNFTAGKIRIYKLKTNDNYICLLDCLDNIHQSEILNNLTSWITGAKNVIGIISLPIIQFQTLLMEEKPPCLIRVIGNTNQAQKVPFLEQPNIVSGLSAGAISYRIHMKKSASLYVCYLDHLPLDSITVQPILHLLKQLQIPTEKFIPKLVVSESNLYL